jgi:hypothetical protein
LRLPVAGRVGVPVDASAVVLNVTVTEPAAAGFTTVFPCGVSRPLASQLNYTAGQTIPNAVVAKVGAGGEICVFTLARAHYVIDVSGYFPEGSFVGLGAPRRVLDSRVGESTADGQFAGVGVREAGSTLRLPVAGRVGVPVDASAVVLNVTVTEPAAAGFTTVFPPARSRPLASQLNYTAGQTIPNAVIVPLGPGGEICVFTLARAHYVIDVSGYVVDDRPANLDPGCPRSTPPQPTMPCADGISLSATKRFRINPALKAILDETEARLLAGDGVELATTIMTNSGPFAAAVATYPQFREWVGDLIEQRPPVTRPDFMSVLETAFHETLHGIHRSNCMQSGPTTGVDFPFDIGFPQGDIHSDVSARIDEIAAAIGGTAVTSSANYAKFVADIYLSDLDEYGFGHQLGEMVSFVLTAEWGRAMTDAFGLEYLGNSKITNDYSMYIKMHQLYRYLARARTMPGVWAEISGHGLPEVIAAYWQVAASVWEPTDDLRHTPPEFFWELMFGDDLSALVEYTGGAVGKSVPPRPV